MPFFDAASGSPLHPVARQALLASLEDGWADPGKLYREGRKARVLLDAAREAAAEAIGCRADEVRFTSSGTRAVQVGMAGVLRGRRRVGRHLIVSSVEHSSVLHVAEQWDGEVTQVPVGRLGAAGVEAYRDALRSDTALACLQAANHEVGTVQPVGEVAEVCGGVPLLVDAAQVLGWGEVPEGWSVLTGSARKWGGPSGVGVLAVRKGVRFAPREDEEFGNLPAVVAAVASLRAVRADAAVEAVRVRELTSRIRERVARLVPDVEVVGDPERRLPGIVTFSCLYVDGETLLHELDRAGFAVSSGSSCTSDTLTPSHVLKAMGVLSEGNVRVSLPAGVAEADVERFLDVLPGVVAGVREKLGAEVTPAQGTVVDSLGKRCPIPVIELAKAIRTVPVGTVVTVLADDEAARLDIPAWCEMTGNEYVGEEPEEKGRAYLIRRIK
ncbi:MULTISPECIES: cysteine desulfurase/sulfurtransferase TusA family protein [unclassified Streptomyces]|uniref:cysteine desulfurase/sulfurtransferase TusA family protein n=1 Tax=unclassified Streptomyces TaxID=2593676 RepID=UPI000DDA656B|nr:MULTISPECIES: cysteine desulfurase/sulfurtransferase TusA family protein [unclassified Streptomyces]QZZ27374.1 aminotransferase class V-fold PLP-dependent enzyme [Streptomyces sp. ST1015]